MRRREFLQQSLVPALAGLAGGCATWPNTTASDADDVVVPMAVDDPHISVEVALNGTPLRFLLDTGADGNVVRPEVAARLGLTLSSERVPASGGSGSIDPVPMTRLRDLAVGTARVSDALAFVMPLPVELAVDGILGASFFRLFAVRFDYASGRLVLARAGRASATALARRLPLRVLPSGKILAQADAAGVSGWYSLDTGAANTVTLFTPTVERLGLRARFAPLVRMVTGLSASGLEYADVARLPWLDIGGWRASHPVAELALASAGLFGQDGWTGNLGGELLRRFEVTIDMRAAALFLEPNAAFAEPYLGPRSGLAARWEQGRLTVVEVVDASPAAVAGIRAGDVVLSVDGALTSPSDPNALRRALHRAPGAEVALGLLSDDGTTRAVVLVLRELA